MTTRPDPSFADRPLAHDYDGIDEYDNPAPFWLTSTFMACIAFAAGYWIWFHAGGPGRSATEELATEWADYQKVRASAKTTQVAMTEEILEATSHDDAVVTRGKAVFTKNCISCHTDDGRGLVGPNLTDEFQIHGVGRIDIYQTIRDGVPAKGMLAWGEILPYDDLRSVAAYVVTLRGTNVPGGKAPEGQRIASR